MASLDTNVLVRYLGSGEVELFRCSLCDTKLLLRKARKRRGVAQSESRRPSDSLRNS